MKLKIYKRFAKRRWNDIPHKNDLVLFFKQLVFCQRIVMWIAVFGEKLKVLPVTCFPIRKGKLSQVLS